MLAKRSDLDDAVLSYSVIMIGKTKFSLIQNMISTISNNLSLFVAMGSSNETLESFKASYWQFSRWRPHSS